MAFVSLVKNGDDGGSSKWNRKPRKALLLYVANII